MKENLLLLFLMVLPLFVSSCSDEDGKFDPMKWKTEVKKSSDDYFHVRHKEEPICSIAQTIVLFG